jgi:hypothetical protein
MMTMSGVEPERMKAALAPAAEYQTPDRENSTRTGNEERDACLDAMAVLAHRLNSLISIGNRPPS